MFSQERAPTSVAYAENQSMFLDHFISDAAWRGRYALNRFSFHLCSVDVADTGILNARMTAHGVATILRL